MRRSRLTLLRARLRDEGLDALCVSSLPNIRYLTGFSGSYGLLVITRHAGWLITDTRYDEQSRGEVVGVRRVISRDRIPRTIAQRRLLRGCARVGIEGDELSVAEHHSLRKELPGMTFRPTVGLVEGLSARKEEGELRLIRRAVRITEQVLSEVLPMIRPGVRESEIAAEITYRQRRGGADGDAFDPIVASGPRSALPHARATGRRIRTGDLVILDLGCSVSGYQSDLTRTVAVGRASRGAREIHALVCRAQEAARAAARPGMRGAELDAVARSIIAAAGHGKAFTHSLGHGIGLRTHEPPRLSPLSSEILAVGNVVTLEPGIYYPGWGGVRVEDDIVLTEQGCRALTHAPKELVIL
jgi:Xaa-Pro aminopeptidase